MSKTQNTTSMRIAMILLVLAVASDASLPAVADSHGKFPGKESLDRSCKFNRMAVELANKEDFEKVIGVFRQAISILSL